MLLTNWKERKFLFEANKLNLKGVAECRFFLQGVKDLRYFDFRFQPSGGARMRLRAVERRTAACDEPLGCELRVERLSRVEFRRVVSLAQRRRLRRVLLILFL